MRRILLLVLGFILIPLALLAEGGYDLNFAYSGTVDVNAPGTVTAGWNFDAAVAGTYANDYGSGSYTLTVGGTPVLVTGDGTWPAGLSGTAGKGWLMDGSGDSLTRSDDGSLDMDLVNNASGSAGSFTVQCALTPYAVPASDKLIMGKVGVAHNDDGWFLYQNSGTIYFMISDTGRVDLGQVSSVNVASALAAYRPTFFTATYEYVGSGNSKLRLYVDDLATASSDAGRGDIWDSSEDFSISPGANGLNGLFQDCRIYKGEAWTEGEHDQAFANFQARLSTGGLTTTTVSASPPAIEVKDCSTTEGCFVDQPANATYTSVAGRTAATALTSKWWRGSCETDDGAGNCQGWAHTDNGGAGAGTVTSDRTTTASAHGAASILFTANGGGAPKYGYAHGACQTNWIGQDVTLFAWGRTGSGTASCSLGITEWSNANCTGYITWTDVTGGPQNPGANWTQLQGTLAAAAWNGATNSWQPRLHCNDNGIAYTAYLDAAMAIQAASTFHTSVLAVADTDADVTTNALYHTIQQPLTAGGPWTIEATVSSPIDGNAGNEKWIFVSPGTDGNKNRIVFFWSADELDCIVYDSGAVGKESRVAMASDPGQQWDVKAMKSHAGVLTVCAKLHDAADWTCDETPATGALQDDISGTAYLGYDGSTAADVDIEKIEFFKRVRL